MKLMAEAIDVLKAQGAVIVDPADLPAVIDPDPAKNILSFDICSGVNNAKGKDENCTVVLKYGMKRDFNAYLATLGPAAPVKSLTELRAWNTAHARAGGRREMEERVRHLGVDADVREQQVVDVALAVGDDALAHVERPRIDDEQDGLDLRLGRLRRQ